MLTKVQVGQDSRCCRRCRSGQNSSEDTNNDYSHDHDSHRNGLDLDNHDHDGHDIYTSDAIMDAAGNYMQIVVVLVSL